MNVLSVLPADFNFSAEINGQFGGLEVMNDHYVIFGTPATTKQTLWLAGTGSRLPVGVTHLQTVRWSQDGRQRVVHVMDMANQGLGGTSQYLMFRVRSHENHIVLDVDHEFMHLEANDDDTFDVWFRTTAFQIPTVRYDIFDAGFTPNTRTVKARLGDYEIVTDAGGVWTSNSIQINNIQIKNTPERVPNGLVFNYRRADGSERLVRCNRVEFGVNSQGVQTLSAWDLDRKDWRSFLLESIIDFPRVEN